VEDGFVSLALLCSSSVLVALNLAENVSPGLKRVYSFLYSGHASLISCISSISLHPYEVSTSVFIRHMKFYLAALAGAVPIGLLGIEMVLTSLAGQKLARLGGFDPLEI